MCGPCMGCEVWIFAVEILPRHWIYVCNKPKSVLTRELTEWCEYVKNRKARFLSFYGIMNGKKAAQEAERIWT